MEYQLNAEEQDILESYERGEWRSVPQLAEEMQRYREIARTQIEHMVQVEIPMPIQDLEAIQVKAAAAGMSYQSLLAQIVHQYISKE